MVILGVSSTSGPGGAIKVFGLDKVSVGQVSGGMQGEPISWAIHHEDPPALRQ
jgi:hypothetical protein